MDNNNNQNNNFNGGMTPEGSSMPPEMPGQSEQPMPAQDMGQPGQMGQPMQTNPMDPSMQQPNQAMPNQGQQPMGQMNQQTMPTGQPMPNGQPSPYPQQPMPTGQPTPYGGAPQQPKKDNKLAIILASIGGVLLIAATIVVIVLATGNNNSQQGGQNDYEQTGTTTGGGDDNSTTTDFSGFTFQHVAEYSYFVTEMDSESVLITQNGKYVHQIWSSSPLGTNSQESTKKWELLKSQAMAEKGMSVGGVTYRDVWEESDSGIDMIVIECVQDSKIIYVIAVKSTDGNNVFAVASANSQGISDPNCSKEVARIISSATLSGGSTYSAPSDSDTNNENIQDTLKTLLSGFNS